MVFIVDSDKTLTIIILRNNTKLQSVKKFKNFLILFNALKKLIF